MPKAYPHQPVFALLEAVAEHERVDEEAIRGTGVAVVLIVVVTLLQTFDGAIAAIARLTLLFAVELDSCGRLAVGWGRGGKVGVPVFLPPHGDEPRMRLIAMETRVAGY